MIKRGTVSGIRLKGADSKSGSLNAAKGLAVGESAGCDAPTVPFFQLGVSLLQGPSRMGG